MGLSGTKQKQRIPDDPRNTKWANDTSAPGFRLLSSMGWTPTDSSLGNANSQSLIIAGGGSTFSKKISSIPTAKDNNFGIGAGKAASGAGIGSIRAMGLPMGSMGFMKASEPGELEAKEAPKTGGEFGRLLERLNAAKLAAAAAEEAEGDDANNDKKRKRDDDSTGVTASAPVTPLDFLSPLAPLSPSTSAPGSPSIPLLKNPRMAARSKHLRAKRLASSSNAAAMAEILGIAPTPPRSNPGSPGSLPGSPGPASVQSSSLSAIPFPVHRATIGTSEPLKINGPTTEGFPDVPRRAFPVFASSSLGTGLGATFSPAVAVEEAVVVAEVAVAVETETEKQKEKREKRERKEAKRARKEGEASGSATPVAQEERVAPSPPAAVVSTARAFPVFTSSSTTGLAATFVAPVEEATVAIEEPGEPVAAKKEKKSKKEKRAKGGDGAESESVVVAMEVDEAVGEEVSEAECKRLKKARKEEKRRKAADAEA